MPDATITWRHGPPLPTSRPHTLPELIAAAVAQHGEQVVLREGDRRWTWRQLVTAAARLAVQWRGQVGRGDRVVIILANGAAHLLAELAAWQLGAIAVPMAAVWGQARLTELCARVEPTLVISDATAVLTAAERGPAAPDVGSAAADPCLILFTSGSSGEPRGVVLTHDNLASQQAAFAMLWPDFGPGDRVVAYLPWHHSFGALAERLWALLRGAELTVVPGGGRDRDQLLASLAQVRPTVFCSVPKLHRDVVSAGVGLDHLRWVFTAGAPLPDVVAAAWAARGIPVVEGWGLTETSPSCTIGRNAGLVGQPIPGVAVGVRGDGEILVRGPNVMREYWRDAVATARSVSLIAGERTLRTGDLGEWQADGLRLIGRADHQLKLPNGEKCSAADLEARLLQQPEIIHALVAAEPDLLAVIELAPGIDDAGLRAAMAMVNAAEPVRWRRIHEVYRVSAPLQIERGQLTASHKIARGAVLAQLRRWRLVGGTDFVRV